MAYRGQTPADIGEKNSLKIVCPTLGEIYSAQGQFKKAIQVYETLIEKYPEDTEKYTQKINELKKKLKGTSNKEAAKLVGELIAERARAVKVEKVVFDRNGYLYHGRVKAFADAARKAGLEF